MLRDWLDRQIASLRGEPPTERRMIDGLRVDVINEREDIDTEAVFERARAVLERVRTFQPARYAHLRRDLTGLLVKRYPCRGAYMNGTGTCLLELTFMVNPGFSDSQVAACLVHEAMHARLDRLVERFGIRSYEEDRARHERICRRAELHFGEAVPDGGPVIQRALDSLAMEDEEVAPAIDWEEANRRVALRDREQ